MARMVASSFVATAGAAGLLVGIASAAGEDAEALRPSHYKKWRNNPKVRRAIYWWGPSSVWTRQRINQQMWWFAFSPLFPFSVDQLLLQYKQAPYLLYLAPLLYVRECNPYLVR